MPQMAPMMWFNLTIVIIFMLMINMIIMYFFKPTQKKNYKSQINKVLYKKLLW